jgi:hypothetical protein
MENTIVVESPTYLGAARSPSPWTTNELDWYAKAFRTDRSQALGPHGAVDRRLTALHFALHVASQIALHFALHFALDLGTVTLKAAEKLELLSLAIMGSRR